MKKLPDIDIDLKNRNELLALLKYIPANINDGKKHNTGIYFNEIPIDPFTGLASIDYKEAEARGYFKFDLLNVNLYKDVKNEEHLNKLINQEPMWELLTHEEFVSNLFHLHNQFKIVSHLQPKNIEQLAAVLAIIRPAKRYLLNKNWDIIEKEVWTQPIDGSYCFSRAHAIAYATAIVLQMNLIVEKIQNFDK